MFSWKRNKTVSVWAKDTLQRKQLRVWANSTHLSGSSTFAIGSISENKMYQHGEQSTIIYRLSCLLYAKKKPMEILNPKAKNVELHNLCA